MLRSASLLLLPLLLSTVAVQAGDEAALLAFKAAAIGAGGSAHGDPLASWNGSGDTGGGGFCGWEGVRCGRRHRRVVALSLPSLGLTGTLSTAVGNLTFLRTLNLSSNWFLGTIPTSICSLVRLQELDLSYNMFDGALPANLSSCVSLLFLRLNSNQLRGGGYPC
jgi:Leucine-rich repeat (LRR) protein